MCPDFFLCECLAREGALQSLVLALQSLGIHSRVLTRSTDLASASKIVVRTIAVTAVLNIRRRRRRRRREEVSLILTTLHKSTTHLIL